MGTKEREGVGLGVVIAGLLAQAQTAGPPPSSAPPPSATPADGAKAERTPTPAQADGKGGGKARGGAATRGEAATLTSLTVTAAAQGDRSYIDRKSYSFEKDLQATTGSVADVLRNVPSVTVDLNGNVALRGDSSVTILVDGQPSALFSGANRGDILQQLPADQYERVEVMTNPSAAYRPDGTGGIINLISKKGSGAVRTGQIKANVDPSGRFNTSLSGSSSKKGGLTLTGSGGYRRNRSEITSDSDAQLIDPATGRLAPGSGHNTGTSRSESFNLRGAFDYDVDPTLRLSGDAIVSHYKGDNRFGGASEATGSAALALQNFTSSGQNTNASLYSGGSASLLRKFAGEQHELLLRVGLNRADSDSTSTYGYAYTPPTAPLFVQTRKPAQYTFVNAKAEYKRPLPNQARLTIGYELDQTLQTEENAPSLGTTAANTVLSSALANLFKGEQTIHALYATWQRPFGKWTVMPGLRLEDVVIGTNLTTTGRRDSSSYFEAYPTLHVNWQWDADQVLTASYSRRVQRPGLSQLNPFRIYNNPLSYSEGNTRLKPQITESFEAGYEFRHTATTRQATLFYRINHDEFSDVVRDLGGGVFLSMKGNLGSSQNGAIEFVAAGKLPWKIFYNASGSVYWQAIDAANLTNGLGDRSAATWNVRGNITWEPTGKDFFQLNAFAQGRQLGAQGYYESGQIVNLGYRRRLGESLFAVVQANDLFAGSRYTSVIDTPTLQQRTLSRFGNRTVYLGLSYAFGANAGKRAPGAFDFGGGGAGGGLQ